MATESFYNGGSYAMDPKKAFPFYIGPLSYPVAASSISTSLDARTANQVKEVTEMLNTGIKNIEIAGHSPGVFEAIPQEHLKELNRLAKLNKASFSLHAPMVDPTGITAQGWDKMIQKAAEEQMWNAVERSHDLDDKGNIVVNFHASTAEVPAAETWMKEGGEKRIAAAVFINPTDGKIVSLKEEPSYFEASGKEPVILSPEKRIEKHNKESWTKNITSLNYYTELGRRDILNGYNMLDAMQKEGETEKKESLKEAAAKELTNGKLYLKDCAKNIEEFYNDVFKNATPQEQKSLMDLRDNIKKYTNDNTFKNLESNRNEMEKFTEVVQNGLKFMGNMQPTIFEPIRDFAVNKSAETFAELAFKGYNKFHDTAPIIAIENHPAQQSLLTTGQDIRDVVEASRKKFVEKAKDAGISEAEAKKQAEKLIGATWDVGHINMMRRYGFSEKDIVKESEKVAPVLKHIHLSDNFGYEHTELPMGMGNVPIKEIMEKFGKTGQGAKKVVEALSWWQHFSQGGKMNPPFVPTMQALGASMYSGGPTWSNVYGLPQPYFAGYGSMLPDQHFQTYGAGFSSLPTELGGQMASTKDRFSGTPMS